MISYHVSIPENKQPFFQEFLDFIGATYQENSNDDFTLSENTKKMLDERLKASKDEFIPAREALKQLRDKHGL